LTINKINRMFLLSSLKSRYRNILLPKISMIPCVDLIYKNISLKVLLFISILVILVQEFYICRVASYFDVSRTLITLYLIKALSIYHNIIEALFILFSTATILFIKVNCINDVITFVQILYMLYHLSCQKKLRQSSIHIMTQ
jgi:hypothetical protein